MSTTATPALMQAKMLTAIADHLRVFPSLAPVNITRQIRNEPVLLQVAAMGSLDEQIGMAPLLAWAKSMGDVEIAIRQLGDNEQCTQVRVLGEIDERPVVVWDDDEGDLYRWREGDRYAWTPITLAQLAGYVAAGTVELAAEQAPAVTR